MKEHIVGLDVGTLKTKAIVFNREGKSLGEGARELGMSFPREGWFEQDLDEIWIKTASAIRD
jgi:sugar (pentulose or hexulose) kinase